MIKRPCTVSLITDKMHCGAQNHVRSLTSLFSGAPKDKRIIILVDDLNMPKLEQYGAQPPIELLRQLQDFRGFYDRDKLFWKEVQVCLN